MGRAGKSWLNAAIVLLGGLSSLWLISLGILATLWGNSFTSFDGVEPGFPWGPMFLVVAGVALGSATALIVRRRRGGGKARHLQ